MKTSMTLGIILFLLPLASSAASTNHKVPEPLHRDILQLIKMTQATNMAQLIGNAVAQQLDNNLKAAHPDISPKAFTIIQDETRKTFANPTTISQLIDRLVPMFAKYYTDKDVRGMIAFYKTPLGQKVIRANPKIAQASMQIGEEWGRTLAPELVQHIQERFKQAGIKLNELKGSPQAPPVDP